MTRLPERPLKVLWLTGLDPVSRMRHGGNLRWLNLSRELLARGHQAYFLVNRHPADALDAHRQYVEELRSQGVLSGSLELEYRLSPLVSRLAHAMVYPPLTNLCLRRQQAPVVASIRAFVAEKGIDLVFVSARPLLFTVPALRCEVPVVVDWVDSFLLYNRRHLVRSLRTADVRPLPGILRDLVAHHFQEGYYTKAASAALVVSPIDKACIDGVSGVPARTHALLNGSDRRGRPGDTQRTPNRLIFTGNMSFPPNHEAAVWFIDHVLPILVAKNPAVTFVIAGRNPRPELLARAGGNVVVLGEVDDLRREIAKSALYVAPLISGGGFKNKIIEALDTGTYVVGTRMAVEFLPDPVRERLRTADEPDALARHILEFVENPQAFEGEVTHLARTLTAEFSWARRVEELLEIVSGLSPHRGVCRNAIQRVS